MWVKSLTASAHNSFLRAAEIGCILQEQWLVSNAAVYLWNYHQHNLREKRETELIEVVRPLFLNMRQLPLTG